MDPKEELAALRRMAELEAKAKGETYVPVQTKPSGSIGAGVLRGMKDPISGGAQLLPRALSGITSLGGMAPNPVSRFLDEEAARVDAMEKSDEAAYQASRGDTGIDFARLGGNLINPANLAIASRLPLLSGLMKQTAAGAAVGATQGALSPVYSDDYAKEKATQVGAGAIGGAIAAPVMAGVSRVIQPKPSAEVSLLQSEGITPTVGQRLGGGFQATESKATSIPALGDIIRGAQGKTVEEFNRAAYNRALAPIGKKSTAAVGQDGVAEVHSTLSNAYKDLLSKVQFKPDGQFVQDFKQLRQMATDGFPEDSQKRLFDSIISQSMKRATPQGNMSGESLKEVETILGEKIRRLRNSGYEHGDVADAVEQFQALIRQSLARQNPDQADALKAINEGWANYAIIREAASRQGAKEGIFTPAQLSSAVAANAKKMSGQAAGKGKISEGKALMQDLSQAGEKVLGQFPNSGTADRVATGTAVGAGAVGGLAYVNPNYLLGVGAAALPYLPGGRQAVNAALTSRPKFASPLADALRNYSPLAAPLFAPPVQSVLQGPK